MRVAGVPVSSEYCLQRKRNDGSLSLLSCIGRVCLLHSCFTLRNLVDPVQIGVKKLGFDFDS